VISTDCPSGPRQIIRDGVDGVLVPRDSVDALSTAMLRLMGAPGARKQLGARAVDVAERFSVSRVTRQWNELLTNCACTVRSG
jgi:GalNAc-alpha-(1->4)-GalNAc-alpha-(1->3)-diNAcBac-PP-undecaprenol alpha-1,4-N-acetyl-D-galactosaminyltransferase